MPIIFFGTSDFAAIILKKIIETADYELKAVITRPDEPAGRKQILTPPPVKLLATEHRLPVLQPEKLDRAFIEQLKKINADIFIVADYGKIIPAAILNLPKYKPLNIHVSLLPKYRGASPMQTALLNSDEKTGISIMEVVPKLDEGPIVAQKIVDIKPNDTYSTLSNRMAEFSANLLIDILPDYLENKITPIAQDHSASTYTRLINKKDGLITPDKTAKNIYRMWRAYTPWPGVFLADGLKFIILEETSLTDHSHAPLTLFVHNKNLFLQCAEHSCLKINSLQPPGKKPISALDYINGYLN